MFSKFHFKSSKDSWWISPVLILLGIISILLGWKQQQKSDQLRQTGICTTATVLRVIADDPSHVDAGGVRIRTGARRMGKSSQQRLQKPMSRRQTANCIQPELSG